MWPMAPRMSRETCICERPDALADLGLREVLLEAQPQDLARPLVEPVHEAVDR